jgi:predicted TIM-barrel fold metal-dependent hydrolase
VIIDVHFHPTDYIDAAWRHGGEPFTGERVLKLMDGPYVVNGKARRIDKGVIQPPPGNTVWLDGMRGGREGVRDYMAYCVDLVQRYPDRFIGNFVYNPRFGVENGVAELKHHVQEHGFKMMKLHSNIHAYRPDRALDWVRPAVRACAELGIPVMMHTGDGPYSIPTQFYPLIKEFREVPFIIAHFGVQTGGVYSFEAFWMVMDSPNVYVESGWCLQSRLVEFASQMPKDRMMLGTDSPPNEPGVWIKFLEVLTGPYPQGMNLSDEDLEGFLGNNAARLLGLEPDRAWETAPDATPETVTAFRGHAGIELASQLSAR